MISPDDRTFWIQAWNTFMRDKLQSNYITDYTDAFKEAKQFANQALQSLRGSEIKPPIAKTARGVLTKDGIIMMDPTPGSNLIIPNSTPIEITFLTIKRIENV